MCHAGAVPDSCYDTTRETLTQFVSDLFDGSKSISGQVCFTADLPTEQPPSFSELALCGQTRVLCVNIGEAAKAYLT